MKLFRSSIQFLIIILLLLIPNFLRAQLPDSATILLANLNQHPVSNTYKYSACWGYRAPNGREYAILGCFAGTSFVDITDTANIHEVAFLLPTNPASSSNEWRE